ncbi:hypothetical protein D3C75_1130590 [compost metagenome]
MKQVTTSMKKMVDKGTMPSNAPLAIGATNIIKAWMLPLIPFTRVSWSSGTSCGRMAPTAGVWTAEPKARMADITKSSQRDSFPAINNRAIIRVVSAMALSEIIISRLRL